MDAKYFIGCRYVAGSYNEAMSCISDLIRAAMFAVIGHVILSATMS
jgi:hypothetical protein